ncbi:MAG: hypothetical protein LBD44_06220 [Spirochaetaceae bacterium]|jgi:tetratricopeptide (TPR) repeat protein|nr:hypothetical protein [Spirochaetaceae bacterium]
MAEIINFENELSGNINKAQDIIWDAWDNDDPDERLNLAKKALEIDPDCADAYNVLGYDEKNKDKQLEYFELAIKSFKDRHNQKFFDETKGYFWEALETRPFMRGLQGYGKSLWDNGRTKEAIETYSYMLTLNPNDNQGIRYILISWLFTVHDLKGVRKLLKTYKSDVSACMMFSVLLSKILEKKNENLIQKYYDAAVSANGYVVPYLLKKKRKPANYPDMYSFGSKEEAIIYVYDECGKAAWEACPEALKVLAEIAQKKK